MAKLEELSDHVLVKNVQKSACDESFKILSKRNENLFYKVCQNYIKTLSSVGYCANDIFEEKDIVLFNAIRRFRPHKGAKFSTWLGNYTRYFCLNKINYAKNIPETGSEEEITNVFNAKSIQSFENKEPVIDLNYVFKTLSKKQDQRIVDIFKLRYNPDQQKKQTWASIAEQLNLTVQTAIQLHKKGIQFLKKEITHEGIDIFQDEIKSY